MKGSIRILLAVVATLVLLSTSFMPGTTADPRPDPVEFDDTIHHGLSGTSTVQARAEGYVIPRAEVFYSQYRYVVGYYGIDSLVAELDRPGREDQFGYPLATYVSDFSRVSIDLTDEGYVSLSESDDIEDTWVSVENAYFVVDSRARTPDGPATLAFSARGDAESARRRFGGEIRRWNAVRQRRTAVDRSTTRRLHSEYHDRMSWANRTAADAKRLLERPVSTVVGTDYPTIAAAIEEAPANSTVAVPPGTYEGNVTVDKPVTIAGSGTATHLRGDGNGSVVHVRAQNVAVVDLRITGVGKNVSRDQIPANESEWDYNVQRGYGYGDAGVVLDRANGSLVQDVAIETPANGVVVRWSEDAVVDRVSVRGAAPWWDGFMGVMVMGSRMVVEDSRFTAGRDGVYTHRAHGLVVRNNTMRDMRFGVHEMYTSNALLANNTVRNTSTGLIVMTRPRNNVLASNEIRRSDSGIVVAGSASYVVDNDLRANGIGLDVSAMRSLYAGNKVVNNDVGLRGSTLIPTNRVVDNTVRDNERAAIAVLGPLRVWSGNYWSSAPGPDRNNDGTLDRSFHPTGPVDGRISATPSVTTLSYSPTVRAFRQLQATVPGLRGTGVVDPRPRSSPTEPALASSPLNTTVVP